MAITEAVQIIRTCVQYALGEENLGVAVDFANFRNRLLSEQIPADDPQFEQLIGQPPFYLSTALRVLLAAVRTDKGARLQHALANLRLFLPAAWRNLPEDDKWSLGELYAEVAASGNAAIIIEIKRALQKVSGFDYVPESLRSTAFRKAAQAVLDAHFSYGNFSAEVPAVQQLASLGTAVPRPALADCMRAYLCVYLGNRWGYSFEAAPTAYRELAKFSPAQWEYYLSVILKDDSIVVEKLTDTKPAARFISLLQTLDLQNESNFPPDVKRLVKAARKGSQASVHMWVL